MTDMRLFFFGMGYSAHATARALHTRCDPAIPLAGTRRTPEGVEALAGSAIAAHLFDGEVPGETLGADLFAATHLVNSIAPDENGDAALNLHRRDIAAGRLQWLCYYSTVGVYGDFGGAWIEESAPCQPLNRRSRQRLAAEQAWRAFADGLGVPLLILRLAGIYGPGRSSFDKLTAGTARRIIKPGQVFNRIHVDDIGRVTALAAEARLAGTYNLADDEPAPPQDLIAWAARRMGVPPPSEIPFETAEMTPMARSFYSDNKRVSNAAIKRALGIELLYPSYRQGLDAIWAARA
jgi:nucleoside-diphosphate-sugar epimerase